MQKYHRILPYLFFAITSFLILFYIYEDTFYYPFHFDGEYSIVKNKFIKDLSNIGNIWSINGTRFLVYLSLAINYHLGELNVFGYHIFNFIVHFLCALTVFWFVTTIVQAESARIADEIASKHNGIVVIPVLVALIFATHPLQTQAVTYIWQRNTSMVALLYFLSLTLYLKSSLAIEAKKISSSNTDYYFIGSVLTAFAAMFTKENAITLPVAIVLAEYYFVSKSIARLKDKVVRLSIFVPVILVIPILIIFGESGALFDIAYRQSNILSSYHYLLTQFNVITTVYLKLLVWPFAQNLDYNFPISFSFADSYIAFIALITLLGFGLWLFSKNRIASFGIVFFFLTMSVESSFYPLEDLVFEHRMYLPLVGLLLTFASLAFQLLNWLKISFIYYLATLFFLLSIASVSIISKERNYVWESHESLWLDVASKSPNKPRAHINLGTAYEKNEKINEAKNEYQKALELNPNSGLALANLGAIYFKQGDEDKAIELYKSAIKATPFQANFYFALATIYSKQKKYNSAAKLFEIGISRWGGYREDAFFSLAEAFTKSGQIDKAIKAYHIIIENSPSLAIAYNNLGALYRHKGDAEKANAYFGKAKVLGYEVSQEDASPTDTN